MKPLCKSLATALLLAGVLSSAAVSAAEDAGHYYEDALIRFDRKDDAGAIVQLKNALKADPSLLAAHMLMGRAALRKGDYATADVSFREAQRLGASRAEFVVPMGNFLLAVGRQKELLQTLQPNDLPADVRYELILLRARAHLELTQYPLAITAVKEARTLKPDALSAQLLHARIALEAGRPDEATALVEQASRANPASGDVWLMRAALSYSAGELAAALANFDHALNLLPGNAEGLLGRSSVLMDMGRMSDAKVSLLELAKADVVEPRATYLRAVVADAEGDQANVRKLLTEVVGTIDPLPRSVLVSRSHLLLIAGLSHLGLGGIAKAKEYLELHIRYFPALATARKPLAMIQLGKNGPASAITTLDPLLRGTRDPEVLTLMASAYTRLKRNQRATELLEEAVRLGKTPELHASLGLSLLGARQVDAGIEQLHTALKRDPGQARASVALALTELRQQHPKRAVEVMEAVVKREPANLVALNLLGVSRAAAGDFAGARRAYEKALAADRNFDSVKLNLVRLDAAEGKPEQARARLDAMLGSNANHAAALYERARLDIAQQRLADAMRGLQVLHDKHRSHVDGHVALIELYIQSGMLDKALELTKEVDSTEPGYLPVQIARARVEIARGDLAGARATLTSITRVADFDPVAQYRIARLQMVAGNLSGATYSLEKALQGDPGFMPARVMQGDLLLAEGALSRAEARAQELMKLPGAPTDAFRLAGDVAASRGQWTSAISHYRSAWSRGAGIEAAGRLYEAWSRSGNKVQARVAVEGLVKERPRDIPVKLLLSQAQAESGQLREAKATLEAVLKVSESAPVLNNLANLQWQLKDPLAQQTAERAHALAPGDALVLDTLGWILAQKMQVDAGLRHLREARLRNPANREVRYHLAWALAKAGRRDEARQEINAALQPGAPFPEIDNARALGAELGTS